MSLGLELSYTGRDTKSTLASLCCQQTLQASCFSRRRQRCSFPSLVPHNGMGYRRGLPKRESPAPAAKGLIWLLLQVLEEQMNKEPVGTGICANNMGTETVLLCLSRFVVTKIFKHEVSIHGQFGFLWVWPSSPASLSSHLPNPGTLWPQEHHTPLHLCRNCSQPNPVSDTSCVLPEHSQPKKVLQGNIWLLLPSFPAHFTHMILVKPLSLQLPENGTRLNHSLFC